MSYPGQSLFGGYQVTPTVQRGSASLTGAAKLSATPIPVSSVFGGAVLLRGGSLLIADGHVGRILPIRTILGKRVMYKVFNKAGEYVENLKDVVSEWSRSEEINSAGSTVTITLGRRGGDFGEGTLIDHNYTVEVWIIDREAPSGVLDFTGKIVDFKPREGASNQVEVVLDSYGVDMGRMTVEAGESEFLNQEASTGGHAWGESANGYHRCHMLQVPSAVTISRMRYRIKGFTGTVNGTAYNNIGQTITLAIFDTVSKATAAVSANNMNLNSLGRGSQVVESTEYADFDFQLNTDVELEPGKNYYFILRTSGSATSPHPGVSNLLVANTNPLPNSSLHIATANSIGIALTNLDPYFIMYASNGSPYKVYNSVEPADILREAIDDIARRGSRIRYTAESIENTGTVVSTDIAKDTAWDVAELVLKLCPPGWYLYLDQATNVLHLHPKAETPHHVFTLGKHIEEQIPDKDIRNIINVIYFTGGDLGNGEKLSKKYVDQTSLDEYGEYSMTLTDGRVRLESTADIMANTYLETYRFPELKLSDTILDNNYSPIDSDTGRPLKGYDIESIKPGQMMRVANSGGGKRSLWGYAKWGEDPWGFEKIGIGFEIVQITKVDRDLESLHFNVSTIPTDISKRIEDIQRNLKRLENREDSAVPVV